MPFIVSERQPSVLVLNGGSNETEDRIRLLILTHQLKTCVSFVCMKRLTTMVNLLD